MFVTAHDYSGPSIDYDELEIGEVLGEGAFSMVYRGVYNGNAVGIKKLKYQYLDNNSLDEFKKEIGLLNQLRHKNVVGYIGACMQVPNLSLVTELMQRGSLFDILYKEKVKVGMSLMVKLSKDIAKGVNYLHRLKPMIIHRDLKSNNILVDTDWTAKIADFGLSKIKGEASQVTGMLGTPGWTAPEIYKNERYNEKVDVYSYGIILREMITLEKPYSGLNGMQIAFATVYQGVRPSLPEQCQPVLKSLCKNCWETSPSKRPSFEKILEVLAKLEVQIARGKRSGSSTSDGVIQPTRRQPAKSKAERERTSEEPSPFESSVADTPINGASLRPKPESRPRPVTKMEGEGIESRPVAKKIETPMGQPLSNTSQHGARVKTAAQLYNGSGSSSRASPQPQMVVPKPQPRPSSLLAGPSKLTRPPAAKRGPPPLIAPVADRMRQQQQNSIAIPPLPSSSENGNNCDSYLSIPENILGSESTEDQDSGS
jgi:serine/threonine protein kinase